MDSQFELSSNYSVLITMLCTGSVLFLTTIWFFVRRRTQCLLRSINEPTKRTKEEQNALNGSEASNVLSEYETPLVMRSSAVINPKGKNDLGLTHGDLPPIIRSKMAEKVISFGLTDEQKNAEREAQRKQLEAIFDLMNRQKDKFGETSIDDLASQVQMYKASA